VTGTPEPEGKPGAHITWSAWFSREGPELLVQEYTSSLGAPSDNREGCVIWRDAPDQPVKVLEVCEPSASGPWRTCPAPPTEGRSIVMISTMTRSE
jgi:hypothetical protein